MSNHPMTRKRTFSLAVGLAALVLVVGMARPPAAQAETNIFASPVHAGCYLARRDRCKIHVEPFTINLAPGQKLVKFQLIAIQGGTGKQTPIYDFRPDVSNPVPASGSSYTPSLVAKDFAATCGNSYTVSLTGQDTSSASVFNLGATAQFTCPTGTYLQYEPVEKK
jgi:hypothetical protein